MLELAFHLIRKGGSKTPNSFMLQKSKKATVASYYRNQKKATVALGHLAYVQDCLTL